MLGKHNLAQLMVKFKIIINYKFFIYLPMERFNSSGHLDLMRFWTALFPIFVNVEHYETNITNL